MWNHRRLIRRYKAIEAHQGLKFGSPILILYGLNRPSPLEPEANETIEAYNITKALAIKTDADCLLQHGQCSQGTREARRTEVTTKLSPSSLILMPITTWAMLAKSKAS